MEFAAEDFKALFGKASADDAAPETDFSKHLKEKFGQQTGAQIMEIFKNLELRTPAYRDEYLAATEGILIFLNDYGLVIRIEYKETQDSVSGFSSDRVDDSPWILKPLASLDTERALVEICPGCEVETDEKKVKFVKEQLSKDSIVYWDSKTSNSGRVPIKMPQFPEGIPVVVDRLAVRKLSESLHGIQKALNAVRKAISNAGVVGLKAAQAQEEFYAPLRQSFAVYYPSKNMHPFWQLCRRYVEEGKLVASWRKYDEDGRDKINEVARAAKKYAARLKSYNTLRPHAPSPETSGGDGF